MAGRGMGYRRSWRGGRRARQWADVATTGITTGDVAGLCRTTDLGAAVLRPDPWRGRAEYNPSGQSRLPEQQTPPAHAWPPRPPPAWPSVAASLHSLPFPGRLPPFSSSFKVMTHILFLVERWIGFYEWELRLGVKLCMGTMGYGLKENISLILSMLRLII